MNTSTLLWATLSIVLISSWYTPAIVLLGFTIPFITFNCLSSLHRWQERWSGSKRIALSLEARPK